MGGFPRSAFRGGAATGDGADLAVGYLRGVARSCARAAEAHPDDPLVRLLQRGQRVARAAANFIDEVRGGPVAEEAAPALTPASRRDAGGRVVVDAEFVED